ncbi:MAG: hypothetical protein EA363_01450 [Balneolaceae bacterium]|nr:MAG: hypothetical protein EA363_01450 [Balneolaceae bacterium]
MGCNSEEEPVPDAPEQKPIELEDVRDDVADPADEDTVIETYTPVEPDTPKLESVDEEAIPEQGQVTRDRYEDDPNAVANALEPQDRTDRDEQANQDRPVVTIPPEVINPQYKPLLNEHNELVVSGRSVDELLELIGEPMSMIRQGQRGSGWHKEVWILPIYQEDSTGLYLYIENNQVADWRLDTFVGIGSHPQLLEWFR